MKVVTWNCNGAFRKKFEAIDALNADILVIQECEDPLQCSDSSYKNWAKNYLWVGDTKHKGLGVFCKDHIQLNKNDWENNDTKYLISARINKTFDLIAVWTQRNNSVTYEYIGQFWKYLQVNRENMNECIVLGDFNSNKIWDRMRRVCNHSDVVRELEEIGIFSLYHKHHNRVQGEEVHPTFYMYRNLAKPYHIDYIFVSRQMIPSTTSFEIGDSTFWLTISDQLPVIAVLDVSPRSA